MELVLVRQLAQRGPARRGPVGNLFAHDCHGGLQGDTGVVDLGLVTKPPVHLRVERLIRSSAWSRMEKERKK